jgi:tape measure domain-containing protein
MTSPIDTAYIDIQPDVSTFARDAERDIDRVVEQLGREFDTLASRIEASFASLGERLESTFTEVAAASERNFDDISRDADRAGRDIADEIERGTESAERSLDDLGRRATREFNHVQREAESTRSSLVSKLGGAGALAAAGIGGAAAAVTAGLGTIATFGLQSAAAMEQSRIQFQSLIGSVAGGNKVFADLQKFAASTPFEFPEVASASARFLAFNQAVGLSDKDLQGFLTTVGNVASVTGGGAEALNSVTVAMGQIASGGKITLDNLNQISEAMPGFSGVAAIASAQGKTTAQVMEEISKGTLNAKDGVAALLEGMKKFPGAAGAMEAQSKTLTGVFSTFKDTIGNALATAFEPALPAIKESLTQITPLLGNALGDFVPAISKAMVALLPVVGNLIQGLSPILEVVANIIGALGGGLGPALESVGRIIGVLLTPLTPLFKVIGDVASVLATALLPVADALAPVLVDLVGPITDILLALVPLIPPLGQLIAVAIKIIAPMIKLQAVLISIIASKALAPVIQLLADGLTKLLVPLGKFAEWLTKLDWGKVSTDVNNGLKGAGKAIGEFFSMIGEWLSNLPGKIGEWLSSLPDLFMTWISNAFDAALHAIGMGIGLIIYEFIHLPEQIISAVTSLGGMIGDFFTGLWNNILEIAVNGAINLFNFVTALPGRFMAGIRALPGLVGGMFRSMFTTVRTLVIDGFNWVVKQVTSIPGKLANLGSRFLSAGRSIINGFINGFKNVGNFIGDIAGSIVGKMKGFLNNVIGKLNSGIADIDQYLPGTLPRIPYLASGGIAYGPSMIGEKPGNRGEAAIPLDDPRALSVLRDALGGNTEPSIVFEEGAITVVFSGVAPSEAEARRVGETIALSAAEILAANQTRTMVRSI